MRNRRGRKKDNNSLLYALSPEDTKIALDIYQETAFLKKIKDKRIYNKGSVVIHVLVGIGKQLSLRATFKTDLVEA